MKRQTTLGFVFSLAFALGTVTNADVNVQLLAQLSNPSENGEQVIVDDTLKTIAAAGLLAISHFNNNNGDVVPSVANTVNCNILPVQVSDTKNSERVALKEMLEYPDSDVVIGPLNSFEAVPTALAAGALDKPVISYGATSTTLDDTETFPTFMRTIPSDSTAAGVVCDLFRQFGYNYTTVIHIDDEYGRAYSNALSSACRENVNENFVVEQVSFSSMQAESIVAAVEKAAALDVNVIVAVLFPEDLEMVVEYACKAGLIGPGKLWIFTDAVTGESLDAVAQVDEEYAKALDGNLRVLAVGTTEKNGRYKEFREVWLNLDSQTIEGINSLFNAALPSALRGNFQFTKEFFEDSLSILDPAAAYFYDAVITAGLAGCDLSTEPLIDKIRNTSDVYGVSGDIRFLENGSRDPSSAYFGLYNLRMNSAKGINLVQVGYLDKSNFVVDNVLFPGDTEAPPVNVNTQETNMNYISDIVSSSSKAFFVVVFLLAVGFAVWIRVHRKSRVVMHSQSAFLYLLLSGIVISSTSLISVIIDDKHVSVEVASAMCMATPWLYSTGFILAFAALFAKTYRVARLFNNKRMLKVVVKTRELVMYVSVLLFLNLAILISWQLTDPLVWKRTPIEFDQFGNVVSSLGQCLSERNLSSIAVVALAALHAILLIYGNVLVYQARHVPTTFQESKWIGLSMASLLQLFALAIPIYFAVEEETNARAFVMAGVIFLTNLVLILAIFVPKFHSLHVSTGFTDTSLDDTAGENVHYYLPNQSNRGHTSPTKSAQEDSFVTTLYNQNTKPYQKAAPTYKKQHSTHNA